MSAADWFTAVLLLAVFVAVAWPIVGQVRNSRLLLRRRVVVNLHTGETIAGVLWARRGPMLVLRQASVIVGGNQQPMDGEAIVDSAHVSFIQAPGG